MKNILILVIIIIFGLTTLRVNSLPQNYNETLNERVKRGGSWVDTNLSDRCPDKFGCEFDKQQKKCWKKCAGILLMWCWTKKKYLLP